MRLEITRSEGGEERHLQLYRDIEQEVLPQPKSNPQESNFSQQFFAATQKKRTSKFIALGMIFFALVLSGFGMQYLPVSQLEPYRPTTLLAIGKKELVRQANALSDIMNYDKCVEQKGIVVSEEPKYCVLSDTRYYQNTSISTPISDKETNLSVPLNAVTMNKVVFAQNVQVLRKGDVQYSGFVNEKFQYAGSITVRNKLSIEATKQQFLDQIVRGEIPFSIDALHEFLLSGTVQEPEVVVDTVQDSELYAQTFKDFNTRTVLLKNTGNAVEKIYLATLATNTREVVLLIQQLNNPFVEAVNRGFEKLCAQDATAQEKQECIVDKVLKDKSIQEKLKSDIEATVRYFALTA